MKKYKDIIIWTILLIIGIVLVAYFTKPQVGKIIRLEKGVKEKTVQVADLQRQLDTLKQNQANEEAQKNTAPKEAKNIYKPDTTSTAAESSFTILFDDLIDMAKFNGIKIYSIKYDYNPAEDDFVKNAGSQYNVCLLSMQLVSDYADLQSFLQELYKYPYLVSVDKLEITPYSKNKKIIVTALQLKLYASKN